MFLLSFHESILNGFQVIERTRLRDGRTDGQTDSQGKNNMSPPLLGRDKTMSWARKYLFLHDIHTLKLDIFLNRIRL